MTMPRTHKAASILSLAMLAALALAAAHPARAQNLVKDGDFEQADSANRSGGTDFFGATGQATTFDNAWTIPSGTVGVDTHRKYVYGGDKSLWLNSDDPLTSPTNTISQTLATTLGQSYVFTFYADTSGPQPLTVTFGGAAVGGGAITVPPNGYPDTTETPGVNAAEFTRYSFLVTAASNSTPLTFSAQGSGGTEKASTLELDDISVTAAPVPEPASWAAFAFMGLGAAGLMLMARKRRAA